MSVGLWPGRSNTVNVRPPATSRSPAADDGVDRHALRVAAEAVRDVVERLGARRRRSRGGAIMATAYASSRSTARSSSPRYVASRSIAAARAPSAATTSAASPTWSWCWWVTRRRLDVLDPQADARAGRRRARHASCRARGPGSTKSEDRRGAPRAAGPIANGMSSSSRCTPSRSTARGVTVARCATDPAQCRRSRLVPRFAAEPPQDLLPYAGRWAQRLQEEFLEACLRLDAEGEDLGKRQRHRLVPRPQLARPHLRAGDGADLDRLRALRLRQLPARRRPRDRRPHRGDRRPLAAGKRDDVRRRDEVLRADGTQPWDMGNSRRHIMDAIDASLRRLQTDFVDLYQLHFDDPSVPLDETLGALDDLVRVGKVRYVGCSNFLAYRLARAIGRSETLGFARFDSVQPRYNLLFREFERELFRCASTKASA